MGESDKATLKIMPIGSPFAFRLNLAKPDSSMPLMIRLLNNKSCLVSFESCRDERMKGMNEHINVTIIPKKKMLYCPFLVLSL